MAIAGALKSTGRGPAGSALFTEGMNSGVDPMFLSDRSYRFSTNTLNRAGIVRTRPGYETVASLPATSFGQGLWSFRPISGDSKLVFMASGKVYATAGNDLSNYNQILPLQFFYRAPKTHAVSGVKSVERNPTDGTLSAIEPKQVLVVQDGGFTRAGVWDGAAAYHSDPSPVIGPGGEVLSAGIPLGGPMAWSGDRLWVAQGNKLFASDIADPVSFVENEYASEGGFFSFDDDIVALAETPALENPVLLVFTRSKTYSIKSYIRDRSTWKSVEQFKTLLFPHVGCCGSRAIAAQNGLLWWMSPQSGLVNFNSAQQARISSRLSLQDSEMTASKSNLAQDLSGVCLGSFENFLLVSVPSGDRYNRHTWVYDSAVSSSAEGSSTGAWASVWTGTYPLSWVSAQVGLKPRCFHLSGDDDGGFRVYECFGSAVSDNGSAVPVSIETKAHIDFSEAATGLDLKRFVFAELTLCGISGQVDVEVLWAGLRGKYKPIAEFTFFAPAGSIIAGEEIGSEVQTSITQTRRVRTPEPGMDSSVCSSCRVESTRIDKIDVGFSLLIRWNGVAGLRSYRIFADPEQESSDGASPPVPLERSPGTAILGPVCTDNG